MPTVKKVSVAIGKEELDWLRQRAEREGVSLSAVVTDAAREARVRAMKRAQQDAAWSRFLDWATDGKGLSERVREAARRELDGE